MPRHPAVVAALVAGLRAAEGRLDALAAWLIGPESGSVTGVELIADGGMTRRMIFAEWRRRGRVGGGAPPT
jgi:hypothetical protein